MKELSRSMLEYRAKNNISQGELAKRCNLTTQTICNVERGIQTPSKITETKIRLVVGNEIDDQ